MIIYYYYYCSGTILEIIKIPPFTLPRPNSAHRQQYSSRLAPPRSIAATPAPCADRRVDLQAVAVLVRAFGLRALVAVLIPALGLAFATSGICPHAGIVLHKAGIFARLRYIGSAVARTFCCIFVRVQLEWILVE